MRAVARLFTSLCLASRRLRPARRSLCRAVAFTALLALQIGLAQPERAVTAEVASQASSIAAFSAAGVPGKAALHVDRAGCLLHAGCSVFAVAGAYALPAVRPHAWRIGAASDEVVGRIAAPHLRPPIHAAVLV